MAKAITNAEVVAEWNSIMPFAIKELDLAKPTEQFLYQALVNYIKMINIDMKSFENRYDESKELTTMNKLKLCNYINYLYQKTDPNLSFMFNDLLHPSPKKTVHLIKILINYMMYMNMVKVRVIKTVSDVVDEHESVRKKLDDTINLENKLKMEEEENLQNVSDIPNMKKHLQELETNEQTLLKEYSSIQNAYQIGNSSVIEKKNKIFDLQSQIVSDEEAEHLENNWNKIDTQIEESTQLRDVALKNFTEVTQNIANVEEIIKMCNNILEYETESDSATSLTTDVESIEQECEVIEKSIENDQDKIHAIKEEAENIVTSLSENSLELLKLKKIVNKKKKAIEKKLKLKGRELVRVTEKNSDVLRGIQTEESEIDFICRFSKEMFKIYFY